MQSRGARLRKRLALVLLLLGCGGAAQAADPLACKCVDGEAEVVATLALSRELQQLALQEFAVDAEIRRLTPRSRISGTATTPEPSGPPSVAAASDSSGGDGGSSGGGGGSGDSSHGQRKLLQIFASGSASRRTCGCARACLADHKAFVQKCAKCLPNDPIGDTFTSTRGECKGDDCKGGGCEVDLFQCGMPRCMYERNNELTRAQVNVLDVPVRDSQGYGNPTGPFG